MKKQVWMAAMILAMTAGLTMTSFAGEWKQDEKGYWWQNDDGSYPVSAWQWLDGNGDGIAESYYFDQSGYLAVNTVIDGYQVNDQGAWIVDGVVQTQNTGSASAENAAASSEPQAESIKLKTDFVKQKYVDLLNKNISHVFQIFGETEPVPMLFWPCYTYTLEDGNCLEFLTSEDGTVFQIWNLFGFELLNADKNTYTYKEMNQLFGTSFYKNQYGDLVWKLDEHVYFLIEPDVSYASGKLIYSE